MATKRRGSGLLKWTFGLGCATVALIVVGVTAAVFLTAPRYLATGYLASPVRINTRESLLTGKSVLVVTNKLSERLPEMQVALTRGTEELHAFDFAKGLSASGVAEFGPLEGLEWTAQPGDMVIVRVPGFWPRIAKIPD
jgi:hypothetical protein